MNLKHWDGKTTAHLKDIYSKSFSWDKALDLCRDPDQARAASWLIKHHAEHAKLTPDQVQQLLDAQPSGGHWDLILHMVQALDRVDLKSRDVVHAVDVLRNNILHDAPFVRAWSLSAFARIAAVHPEYREDARQIVFLALQKSEKPSVVARLKKAAAYLERT